MFGYVNIAPKGLSEERVQRYRSYYCGLCHALKAQYGAFGRALLSYDMTFLSVLLHSLYEFDEMPCKKERCFLHPIKPHSYINSDITRYCADMNIILSYHKCKDDWNDDRKHSSLYIGKLLEKHYQKLAIQYPKVCETVENSMAIISQIEKQPNPSIDALANETGRMLGSIYRYRDDSWADTLDTMGQALGRFIYLMDAYDDFEKDMKKKNFNPLVTFHDLPDYEDFIKQALTLCIGECAEAFELLPLDFELDILRNILYSGCWSRYYQIKEHK